MRISVVIPAFNEERWIGDCLQSLVSLNDPCIHEVIVADNGSTDRTVEIAQSFDVVKVVTEERKGVTRAREKGFNAATGELIASIDADVRVTSEWIATMKRRFGEDHNLVYLSGIYEYYGLALWKVWLLRIFEGSFAITRKALGRQRMIHARGGNAVYRADALRRIGGFSVDIDFFGEDRDVMLRMKECGRIDEDPSMSVKASARRFNNEGFFRTLLNLKMNATWQDLTKKTLTHGAERDWR